MLVDLGVLEEFPSNTIPGFNEALIELVPDARGPRLLARPARRLHHDGSKDGTWLGHVAEHVALELQSLAGTESHVGKTRARRASAAATTSIYEYREEDVGLEAGRLAGGAGQPPRRAGRGAARLRARSSSA